MRIVIFGCGGSGKSTLALQLGKQLKLPVIHLDQLYWRPGWKHITDEEFDVLLQQELIKKDWIMDGNYNRTLPLRMEYSDIILYLDFSRLTCLRGAIRRVIKNHGKTRQDMGVDCPERFDLEFLSWIWNFNKNNRKRYYQILSELQGKEVHVLKKREEIKGLITQLAATAPSFHYLSLK